MNYSVSSFLLLLCIVTPLSGAREKEQFLRGNKFFKEHAVDQALKEYQEITHKGPILWYNIGVCHEEQKDPLQALVAFLRAQKGASYSLLESIDTRLEVVQKKLGLSPGSEFETFALYCSALFSLFWLQLLFLALWWTCALFSWLTVPVSRLVKGCLIAAMIGVGFLMLVVWLVSVRDTAIVIKDSALFIGPNTEFHTVGEVRPGQRVTIKKRTTEWFKVKTEKLSGWINTSDIEPIELNE